MKVQCGPYTDFLCQDWNIRIVQWNLNGFYTWETGKASEAGLWSEVPLRAFSVRICALWPKDLKVPECIVFPTDLNEVLFFSLESLHTPVNNVFGCSQSIHRHIQLNCHQIYWMFLLLKSTLLLLALLARGNFFRNACTFGSGKKRRNTRIKNCKTGLNLSGVLSLFPLSLSHLRKCPCKQVVGNECAGLLLKCV